MVNKCDLNFRSDSAVVANLILEDCSGTTNVVSLHPRCDESQTVGAISFHHVEFRNIIFSGHQRLIEAIQPNCASLLLENVVFRENQCGTGGCLSLPKNNTLTNIVVVGSREESNASVDIPSFLALPVDSEIVATNVSASGNGIRLFDILNSTFTLINSHFDGNVVGSAYPYAKTSVGGSVLLANHSIVTILDSIFVNNSGWNGGVVYAADSYLSVSNCTFRKNDADVGYGGALMTETVNASITNSTFLRNNASFGGACFFRMRSRVFVEGIVFDENHAETSASAIYINGSVMDVQDSVFENNGVFPSRNETEIDYLYRGIAMLMDDEDRRLNGHGTVDVDRSNVSFTKVRFYNNSGDFYGGGVYVHNSNITVKQASFVNNSAGWRGGAIHASNQSRLEVSDSLFHNNSVRDEGGGIYACCSDFAIRKTNLTNNTAGDDGGGGGYFRNSNLTLNDVIFLGNRAPAGPGGGVFIFKGRLNGASLTFLHNQASGSGGGIYGEDLKIMELSKVSFQRNNGSYGGAISIYNTTLNISQSCIFTENNATTSGGSIRQSLSHSSISSCYFKDNTAKYGGSMWIGAVSQSNVSNCSFKNSTASSVGGGFQIYNNTKVSISNSSFSSKRTLLA